VIGGGGAHGWLLEMRNRVIVAYLFCGTRAVLLVATLAIFAGLIDSYTPAGAGICLLRRFTKHRIELVSHGGGANRHGTEQHGRPSRFDLPERIVGRRSIGVTDQDPGLDLVMNLGMIQNCLRRVATQE